MSSTNKNAAILSDLESNELPVNLDELPNFKIKSPTKDIFASDYISESSAPGIQIQVAVKFI
jgi:hypothetical protein